MITRSLAPAAAALRPLAQPLRLGHANAAGSGVDQNGLARGEFARGEQALVRGSDGDGPTRRARRINRELAEYYPDARCELDFTSALETAFLENAS